MNLIPAIKKDAALIAEMDAMRNDTSGYQL